MFPLKMLHPRMLGDSSSYAVDRRDVMWKSGANPMAPSPRFQNSVSFTTCFVTYRTKPVRAGVTDRSVGRIA
jgi:hypothetical protein